MKHNIHLPGYAFALRPVELEDAKFIVELRSPERTRLMHPIARTVEAQKEYLRQYFQRPDDYYFVIQRKHDKNSEGLTGLFDFTNANQSAQWGRLVLRPSSFASAETALLVCRLAFDRFRLAEVWGFTLTENIPMIAYLKSCGFEPRGSMTVTVSDKPCNAIKLAMTGDQWQSSERKLTELAKRIAQMIQSSR